MPFRVGCSGWSYKHWRDIFYPHGLRQSGWFAHYASIFDTVEINNSFYRTPTDETFRGWRDEAPPGFSFAVKVNRSITQFYKLGPNAYPLLEEFVRRARLMGNALGPLLLQLPPSLGRDERRLASFLALPAIAGCRLAVEFRKSDWFADEVYDILRGHDVALVLSDLENLPVPAISTASWTYARFHGAGGGKYEGSYSDEQLNRWAELLKQIAPEGFVYFNNDIGGAAPGDAIRMRTILNG